MIIGDDGGAQVTFNGGDSKFTYRNQPTAQLYRVTTDTHFPYRIYDAQQGNSTVRILHRSEGTSITERHWELAAGGESGHNAPHPLDPDIVYGGLLIRLESSNQDLTAQFNFLVENRDKLSETHTTFNRIETIRAQVQDIIERTVNRDQTDSIKKWLSLCAYIK